MRRNGVLSLGISVGLAERFLYGLHIAALYVPLYDFFSQSLGKKA